MSGQPSDRRPFAKAKRLAGEAGVSLAVLWLVGSQFVTVIPPASITTGVMEMSKRRVLRYAQQRDRLPGALSDTEVIPGYHAGLDDGWGRALLYSVRESLVELRSYGADGLPGGAGDDRDWLGVFTSRTPSGAWADEFAAWHVRPRRSP